MAKGIKIADFFAQVGFKIKDKDLDKIQSSFKKINSYLEKTGATASKTGVKLDKAFQGEGLKRQRLLLKSSHDALIRMGGEVDNFNRRLAATKSASGFLKLKNEIKEAEIAMRRLKFEASKKPKVKPTTSAKSAVSGLDMFLEKKSTARLFEQLGTEKSAKLEAMARSLASKFNGTKREARAAEVAVESWARAQIKAAKDADKFNKRLDRQQLLMRRLKTSTLRLAANYVGVFAAFEATRSVNTVGQDFEGMEAAMLASSGSAKLAAEDLAFVDKEAVRLGLDLRASTDAFSKLQFAAKGKMTREETKELFTGFSEFATALKVGPEQAKSGLRALQQINI